METPHKICQYITNNTHQTPTPQIRPTARIRCGDKYCQKRQWRGRPSQCSWWCSTSVFAPPCAAINASSFMFALNNCNECVGSGWFQNWAHTFHIVGRPKCGHTFHTHFVQNSTHPGWHILNRNQNGQPGPWHKCCLPNTVIFVSFSCGKGPPSLLVRDGGMGWLSWARPLTSF